MPTLPYEMTESVFKSPIYLHVQSSIQVGDQLDAWITRYIKVFRKG